MQNDRRVVAIQRRTDQVRFSAPDDWRQFDLALANLLAGDFEKATN